MAEKEKILRIKLLGDKQTQASLERLQQSVDRLGRERKQLNAAERKGLITSKAASRQRLLLNTQLKVARTNLNALTRQQLLANGAIKAGTGLQKSITRGFANMALRIGGATAAFLLIKNAISGAFNIVKDFQQANADLAAVLGKTRDEIRELTDDSKRLGGTTKFTATEVAKLQKEFAKLGFTTKEILNATEATLDLAAATGTDLAEAATVVGATVRGFGLDASETQRVVDVMAKSFSSSALDMDKFKVSMSKIAPVAKAVGLTIEETTGIMGTLADSGIEASIIGTSLRRIFIELSKKGLSLNDALDKIRNSTDKLSAAEEIFGARAATAALVLAENADKAAILTAKLNLAAGAAERMADEQLNTLEGKLTILNSAWEGWILSIDEGDGAISNMIGTLAEFATGILSTLAGTKDLTTEFNEQQKFVALLEANMTPLLDRYDELASKSELSKIEQEELNLIIETIAENIPAAVTEFDKYGKALGISTTAARAFVEQQKEILKIKNAEAIEEQKDEIKSLGIEYETLTRGLNRVNGELFRQTITFTKGGRAIENNIKLTNEEIASIQKRKGELKTEIDTRNAIIDTLSGQKTEAELLAEAEAKALEATLDLSESESILTKSTKEASDNLQRQIDLLSLFQDEVKNTISETDALVAQQQSLYTIPPEEEEQIIEDSDFVVAQFQKSLDGKQQALEIALQNEQISQAEANSESAILTKEKADFEIEEAERVRQEKTKKRQQFLQVASTFIDAFAVVQARAKAKELSAAGDNAEKREEIERKFAKKEQSIAIAQAAIRGAMAVMRIAADVPKADYGIATALLIAAQVASTIAQIAFISSQEFQDGGVLKGNSHARGGIPFTVGGRPGFEAEGGEALINKRSTAKYGSLLSAINQAEGGVAFDRGGRIPIHKFRHGAITPVSPFSAINAAQGVQQIFTPEDIALALSDTINDIKVTNVVTQTTEGQKSVANVVSEATIG